MGNQKNGGRNWAVILRRMLIPAMVLILSLGMLGCEEQSFCMYTKNAELWMHHLDEEKGAEPLTDDFVPIPEEFHPANIDQGSVAVNRRVSVEENSLRLFYPTNLNGDIYSLKYKENGVPGESAELVASDVKEHWVNEGVSRAVCWTNTGRLFRYHLDDPTELNKKKVVSCFGTKKEADVCYLEEGGWLYFQSGEAEPWLIGEEVDELYGFDCNSWIYYLCDDLLYVAKNGEEGKTIADEVVNVMVDPEYSGCYYLTEHEVKAEDVFKVDVEDAVNDRSMNRISYYDGSGSTVLGVVKGDVLAHNGRACFIGFDERAIEKITEAEIQERCKDGNGIDRTTAIQILWDECFDTNNKWRLAVGNKLIDKYWDLDAGFAPCMKSAGDLFCYTITDEQRVSLHALELKTVALPDKLLHRDIQLETLRFFGSEAIPVYLTNTSRVENDSGGWIGELWMYDEQIAKDAYSNRIWYDKNSESLLFLSEYDVNSQMGTLMRGPNGSPPVIAKNVYYFAISTGGDLIYLQNYDLKNSKGDLFLYRDGEHVPLDTGVANIIQCG